MSYDSFLLTCLIPIFLVIFIFTSYRLSALDDHKVARMRFLQHERDTTAALNWLRENRAMFQSKIHEPVMLELSVRDPRYARAVENILPWPVLKVSRRNENDDQIDLSPLFFVFLTTHCCFARSLSLFFCSFFRLSFVRTRSITITSGRKWRNRDSGSTPQIFQTWERWLVITIQC